MARNNNPAFHNGEPVRPGRARADRQIVVNNVDRKTSDC